MKQQLLVSALLLSIALPASAGSWTPSGNSGAMATFSGIAASDVSNRLFGITYSSTSTATASIGVFYSVSPTIDFSRYVYTVQVTLSRTATSSIPTVRGLRIH